MYGTARPAEAVEASPIRIAVAVAIDPRGRLLVVRKRGTRMFIQPGGKIDEGETAAQALCRELHEEIGWRVAVEDLSCIGTICAVAANEPDRIVVAQLFSLRPMRDTNCDREIEEVAWLTAEDANLATTSRLTRQVIETCLNDGAPQHRAL